MHSLKGVSRDVPRGHVCANLQWPRSSVREGLCKEGEVTLYNPIQGIAPLPHEIGQSVVTLNNFAQIASKRMEC